VAAATGADALTDGHSSFIFIFILFSQLYATVRIALLALDFSILFIFS